jgi:hypothetical protein
MNLLAHSRHFACPRIIITAARLSKQNIPLFQGLMISLPRRAIRMFHVEHHLIDQSPPRLWALPERIQ